ncbi:hypothetical protein NGM37_56650, partial [Streptomyces sp. TRM76130]|nr:hypothetical protein [Streptomyces sp. TRM76130]
RPADPHHHRRRHRPAQRRTGRDRLTLTTTGIVRRSGRRDATPYGAERTVTASTRPAAHPTSIMGSRDAVTGTVTVTVTQAATASGRSSRSARGASPWARPPPE